MMGVAAQCGKCRILITMRFKVQQRWHQEYKTSARLSVRCRADVRFEKSVKFILPILLFFLKLIFSLDRNINVTICLGRDIR